MKLQIIYFFLRNQNGTLSEREWKTNRYKEKINIIGEVVKRGENGATGIKNEKWT